MRDTIAGLFLPPGARASDPRQVAQMYIPPGLLNTLDEDAQSEYGRFIQGQINRFGAHRRPDPNVLNQIVAGDIGATQAQRQQQQLQGQLGNIFGGAPMPGQAAPAGGARRMPQAPAEINQAINAAAQRYGVDPVTLTQIAQIESGFDPMAQNPNSSAGGLFQFLDETAQQYGLQNKFDPVQSADAAARKMRNNAQTLSRALDREPTPGELYLAHQQGAAGAARLLQNKDKRAVDVVGRDQVLLNGGTEDMTAGEFANMWMSRVQGGQQPGQAQTQRQGPRGQLQQRADQYFQAADMFASQGDVATAQKYHSMGLDLLKETPAGRILSGTDIGLDPDQTYFVDKDGKPSPLGPVAGENAGAINTIHNTYQTISRDNRDQLIASDRALTALESTDDFATSTALLNWLTSIGARPRVGADGNYTTESGFGAEFTRIINLIGGGGQLTEQQRSDLRNQITQARAPILDRQNGLNDVLKAQLEQLNVPKAVIDQMIRSVEGSEQPAAPAAPQTPAAPAAAAPGAPVTISSDEEYDRLPSGSVFVGPDGVTRRKP